MSRSLPLYLSPNGGEKLGATDIDSLQIQINAEASRANDAIDRLCSKLGKLETSLNGISKSSFSGVTSGLRNLNLSLKEISNVRVDNLSKLAASVKKISSIDATGLTNTSKSIRDLSNGLRDIGRVHVDTKNIVDIANAMSILGRKKSFDGTANLAKSKKDIIDFVTGLNSVGALSFDFTGISNLVANMQKLGSKSVTQATTNLKPMKEQLLRFVSGLNGIGALNFDATNLAALVSSLSKMGGKSVSQSITNIPLLAKALKDLMAQLSTAPKVSQNLIDMTTALGNLAAHGSKVGTANNAITKGFNRTHTASAKAGKGFKSLSSIIGKFYQTYFAVIRGIKQVWKSIESSMDYIETLNYFDAAFGQVASNADYSGWKEAGYDSAEAYYNSFSERAKDLTSKMSGFSISESGMLKSNGAASLGVDPAQVMNYQAMFGQMASSMGVTSENALKLSSALTEIGADLASVKNMDFSKVWTDMSSGLAGMSRTLDKYGANIRNVNLQQKLTELGINANITALNQNDKALLRTIILLDSTRYAWGDMANTINQPANQLRLLRANFSNLARTIGNIFLPIVAKVLPYINMLVQSLQRLAQFIVKLLGFEGFDWGGVSGGGANDALSDIYDEAADSAGGLSDKLGDAAKNAKKLYNTTLGIDELNVNSPNDSSSSGSSSSGGGLDAAGTGLLNSALDKILEEYQAAWDKAFSEMEQRANTFADNVAKSFKDGGLKGVGEYLTEALANALSEIPWGTIYEGVRNFGTGLANFLNGLISPGLFGEVGNTVASALNTALYISLSFGETFDFTDLGESITSGINNFFATFDFAALASTLNTWVQGIWETIKTAIANINWGKVWDSAKEFMSNVDIKTIAIVLGAVSIKKILGLHLGSAALSLIGTTLSQGIAQSIASKLGIEIAANAGIKTALSAGLKQSIIPAISEVGTVYSATIQGFFGNSAASSALAFVSPMSKAIAVIGAVAAVIAILVVGLRKVYESNEEVREGFANATQALKDGFQPAIEFITNTLLPDLKAGWKGFQEILKPFTDFLNDTFVSIWQDMINPALTYIGETVLPTVAKSLENLWSNVLVPVGKFLASIFSPIIELVSDLLSMLWKNVILPLADVVGGIFKTKFESLSTLFNSVIVPVVKTLISVFQFLWNKVFSPIINFLKTIFMPVFKMAFEKIGDVITGLKKIVQDVFDTITNIIVGAYELVTKVINGILKGINWVLKKFGSKDKIELLSVEKFAKGANGLPEDTVGMVNDQKGSTYKELIVPPHGEPFIPNGRNVLLPLEKGTKIMPANQTKALMSASGIPKFKNGIGNFFSGAWASIKDFTGNVLDYIANPGKLIKIAIDKFVDATGWAGVIGDVAGGVINKVFDSAVDFIKGQFGTSASYTPGAGVEQWRSLATRALRLTGHYSDSNLAALLAQMSHESGGNPNAINNWDVNAKNGTPSKGLMQVIDPTFRRYAMPPYNTNIYDPLSNMIASIRYTVSTYGSLYKGWTARGYKGYANGIGKIGFADLIPAYVNGGFPEDGLFYANHNELVGRFSNGDTAVANNDQIVAGIKAGVKEAVAEVLAPYLRDIRDNTRETADKDFTTRIDTRTLVSEYNSRSKRNGFSFT